jgi:hypothetical protein
MNATASSGHVIRERLIFHTNKVFQATRNILRESLSIRDEDSSEGLLKIKTTFQSAFSRKVIF